MSETPRQAWRPNGETRTLNIENQSKSRDILFDFSFEDSYKSFAKAAWAAFFAAAEDGSEVDILTAARTGFISQGLAIFVLENIRQSRDFIAHGGALRETLRHYLDA